MPENKLFCTAYLSGINNDLVQPLTGCFFHIISCYTFDILVKPMKGLRLSAIPLDSTINPYCQIQRRHRKFQPVPAVKTPCNNRPYVTLIWKMEFAEGSWMSLVQDKATNVHITKQNTNCRLAGSIISYTNNDKNNDVNTESRNLCVYQVRIKQKTELTRLHSTCIPALNS